MREKKERISTKILAHSNSNYHVVREWVLTSHLCTDVLMWPETPCMTLQIHSRLAPPPLSFFQVLALSSNTPPDGD